MCAENIVQNIDKFNLPFNLTDLEKYTCVTKYIDSYLYNLVDIDNNDFYKLYQDCVDICIKSSNMKGMLCLWEGYYYHDRAHPYFFRNLFTSAEYGDIKTVVLALVGYYTWFTFDGNEDFEWDNLIEISKNNLNTDVYHFLINIKKSIERYCNLSEEIGENENLFEIWEATQKGFFDSLMKKYGMYDDYLNTNRACPQPEDV
jgi:hypothetical protein